MQEAVQENIMEKVFVSDEGVSVREIGKPNIKILAMKLIDIHGKMKKD